MSFAGGSGASLGSAEGRIVIRTEDAERALKQLQGSVNAFGTSSADAFQRVAVGVGLLAGARQLGNLFGGMVGQAANLEQVMSGVAASLGGVGTEAGITREQFNALNDEALRIGAETSKSATEAAAAMDMMAKAGVDVGTILDTGAQAAVNLSEATGEGLAQSAETMSSMLLLFQQMGLEGGRAADIITTAMNASNASLSEFQTGVARLAPTITIAGLSFEEAAAAVAYFNSQGFSAAEAGSSLNSAFLALTNPTEEATAAMQKFGIVAFDAQGDFIGFPALMDNVNQALAGVTSEADRAQILTTIFGRDALDVMALGANNGGAALRDMTTEMAQTGTAAESSKIRMDNFAGSVEQLRGAIETASIAIGRTFLPVLRRVVDALTVVVNGFTRLPSSLQAATGVAIVASAAIAGIAGAMVLAGPRAKEFAKSLQLIRATLLGMNPLLLALVAGVALLALGWKTNFGGMRDQIEAVIRTLKRFAAVFARSFAFSRSLPEIGNLGAAFAAVGQAMTEILGINVYKQFRTIGNIADRIGKSLNRMSRQFGVLSRAIKRGGLAEGFDQLFGKVGTNLLAEFGDLLGALPRTVGTALRQITTGFDPLDRALKNLGSALQQFGRFVENVFAGDFDRALQNFQNIGKRLKAGAIDISGIVVRIASWAFETLVDLGGAVRSFVTDTLWPQVKSTAAEIPDAAVRVISWAVDATGDLIAAVATFVTDAAWPAVKDTATDIADAVVNIASWSVRAASGLWDAVSATAAAAWNLVKNIAVELPDVALNILHFAVRSGASIWDSVDSTVRAAWELVKDTAIQIKDVALSVFNWVTDQIDAGTLVDSVRQFVEDTLATLNVTIDNWKLTVGAPGGDQISIDVSGIWDKIWNDLIHPQFTAEQEQGAQDAGAKIGQKAVDLIIAGIKALFGAGGGAGAGGGQKSELPKLIGAFLQGLFTGAFAEALGIGADLAEQAREWAGNTRDAIVQAIRDVFTGRDGLNTSTAGTGIIVEQAGLFDGLRELFTTNPLEGIDFPDLITPVKNWFGGQIAGIQAELSNQVPEWLKKLAGGDVLGAVKDIFGGGSGKQEVDISTLPIGPNLGGGAGHGGGFRQEKFFDNILPTDFNERSTDFRQGLADVGAQITTFAGTAAAAAPSIQKSFRDILSSLSGGEGGAVAGAGSALKGFADKLKLPAPDLSALIDGLGNAVNVTRDAMGEIVDVAAGVIGPLASAGQNAAQSFAASITNGMRIAIGAAATGAQQVVNAARANLGTLGPSGFGVGQSLGFGIANGITSTIGAVVSAAVNLVLSAVNAARATAQIGSPSRLFAEKVGLPIAQGMAIGISDGGRTVQRSISDLIGAAIPATSTSRMLGSQPIGAAAVGARGSTTVNVYALKSDEYLDLITRAQRGSGAADFVDNLPRSYGLVFGGGA